VKLLGNGLDVTVSSHQRIGTAGGSQLQKDGVLPIANVGQAIRLGVDLDGFDAGQEVGQQGLPLVAGQLELGVGKHPQNNG